MSALDDINSLLHRKDEDKRGFEPVAPWQGGNAGEDVNGNPTTTEQMARATRKRAGLPVDDNPHDHTGTPSGVEAARKNAGEVHGGGDDISTNGTERPHYSIAELIKLSHPYNEERTKEEEERQKKKQKRDAVFAAIGDGLNAFHQAYAYSRGIKPLTENKSQSKAVRDKYDALDKEREAHKAEYLNAYIRGLQMDEERANKVKDYEIKERQQKRLEEEAKRKHEASQAQIKAHEARANKDDQLAALYEAKAESVRMGDDNKTREIDARIRVHESTVRKNDAAAAASNALEEQRRSDNTSTTQTTITRDNRGRETGRTTTTKKRVPTGNGKKSNPMGDNNNNGKKQNPMNQ